MYFVAHEKYIFNLLVINTVIIIITSVYFLAHEKYIINLLVIKCILTDCLPHPQEPHCRSLALRE